MAHGDYDCCAVCDSKLGYNEEAETKNEVCTSCAVELAKRGVFVKSPDELVHWMNEANPVTVLRILNEVHFETCIYGNYVDDVYREIKAKVEQ